MAKRVRDSDLETRAARAEAEGSGKPYYKVIRSRASRRLPQGQARGMWVVRRYAGGGDATWSRPSPRPTTTRTPTAQVLTFWQAQEKRVAQAC